MIFKKGEFFIYDGVLLHHNKYGNLVWCGQKHYIYMETAHYENNNSNDDREIFIKDFLNLLDRFDQLNSNKEYWNLFFEWWIYNRSVA